MGRFSSSGARLHELRQPKPNNAAFRQSWPPRSHGSSLGLEHPQSAIRPACREGPTWTLSSRLPCPQRSGGRTRRGGQEERSTPLRATSARRRQFGGDAGPRGPSRIRRSAPRPGHIDRQAEQGGLASAADRGNPGKSPQRRKVPQKLLRERRTRVGKSRQACRTPAALSIAARGRTCPKGPENGLRAGSCADASAPSAIAAPEAPQERRRGCTRTPRRRRRSGWTGP